jgi:hypothetical protein
MDEEELKVWWEMGMKGPLMGRGNGWGTYEEEQRTR